MAENVFPVFFPVSSPSRRLMMPLQEEEVALLQRCEVDVESKTEGFLRAGRALKTIKQGKLYRATHRTFNEYLKHRWANSPRKAYLEMQVVGVFDDVHNCAHIDPSIEDQLRKLEELPNAELRRTAWQRAVAYHDERGWPLTGSKVM